MSVYARERVREQARARKREREREIVRKRCANVASFGFVKS